MDYDSLRRVRCCGLLVCVLLVLSVTTASFAGRSPSFGAELEGFAYPYPVKSHKFESQRQPLQMTYMDVAPSVKANGGTAVLLHGKNFCAATWAKTIETLAGAGYRVIAPDQIGFCKSTKPKSYQYSFQQLAQNTRALLQSLKVTKITLLGHSMGGMLAARYALMFPSDVEKLVLINPIGLEDWKAKGVPFQSLDSAYATELEQSEERIRNYQRSTYYAGSWKPQYDVWVEMLAGMFRGPGKELVAWSSALTYDMIFTQPVYYELEQLGVPVLLLIGTMDTTAIGKDRAPEALRGKLGQYSKLAAETHARIPRSKLVTFADLGHAPQIQDPARFHKALLEGIAR